MTVLSDMNAAIVPGPDLGMSLNLEPEEVFSVEAAEETYNEVLEWVDSPATASWGPFMAEVCVAPSMGLSGLIIPLVRSSDQAGGVHHL
jgi:hypothetical protein